MSETLGIIGGCVIVLIVIWAQGVGIDYLEKLWERRKRKFKGK
jgi:hypothetical protein